MEKLRDALQKEPIIQWLNKKDFLGREQRFEILDVSKLNNDIVLTLGIYPDEQFYMRISASMKNELIDHFGNDPALWLGMNVDIVFSKFTPKQDSGLSEGVSTAFAWPTVEKA